MARTFFLLVTLAAALCAALIVAPAPSKMGAFVAVAVGEKSFVPALVAILGLVATWWTSRGCRSAWRWLALLLAGPAVVVSAYPFAQAAWIAAQREVPVDLGRYLLSRVDDGQPLPDQTVPYVKVGDRVLSLDVYRPAGPAGQRAPAVVVLHGGGWSSGDKGEVSHGSRWLAQRGFAVFDVQYRLAPQPNWRTAVGDVKCAIGWVKSRAASVGVTVDPTRVSLLGRSAGGHLALLAGYTPGDPSLPPSCPAPDTRVNAVVAFYAPTDLVWGYSLPANPTVYDTSARLREFLGGTPETAPEAYHAASIVNRVTVRAPRTLLLHGGRDQFVSPQHVDRLVPHLKAAGVPHETVLIPYGQHGFDFIHGGLSGQIAEAAILPFLNQDAPVVPKPPVSRVTVIPAPPPPDAGPAVDAAAPTAPGASSATTAVPADPGTAAAAAVAARTAAGAVGPASASRPATGAAAVRARDRRGSARPKAGRPRAKATAASGQRPASSSR